MDKVEEVLDIIRNNDRARHNTRGHNFPFFTRNPERPKYKDDFNEIIGIIARISIGKQKDILNVEDLYRKNIINNLDFDKLDEDLVLAMFKLDFASITKANMFLYYPVKAENKNQQNELKGKKILAEYITKLFKLDENTGWKNQLQKQDNNELYESFIVSCLPVLSDLKDKSILKFNFFNQDYYLKLFNQDLNSLMINDSFFNQNIALFISYYYFYYVTQETYYLSKKSRDIIGNNLKTYYAFDKEKISTGRSCVKEGYNIIQTLSKKILLDNDLINYLNELLAYDRFYSLAEIYDNDELKEQLKCQLTKFNEGYSKIHDLEYEYKEDLTSLIDSLRAMLKKKNISAETASRYRKSFDEYSNLSFIKKRGRCGYVFNASEDLILMFVCIIVGRNDRILVRDFFVALERRGLYFDKVSQFEIINYFENLNILDKLSDSGDAQYVRSIL